jgi:serine/threonine-protein kinase
VNAPPAALLDARYRLGPIIARGGMSTVYRGTDTRLDRPVAIKVMDGRLAADPAFRTRLEREARSAARIDHPAVVDVFDQGDDRTGPEPVLFLVMELVEGGTLRDVLRARGQLGVPAALAVLDPVLAGLAQAHRLGLVHRDVKPENVLVSHTGEVKVADFGLVVAAAQAGNSHVGTIMGTVAYLSPEQVSTGAADSRSDVYAAGILLYELLTGAPPYVGDTAISVAFRHVTDRVPAPSLIAGDVPPELDALVRRATDPDPAGRPADAAAMLDELRRLGRELEVPRVGVPLPPPPEQHDTVPRPRPVGPAPAAAGPRGTQALPVGAVPPAHPSRAHPSLPGPPPDRLPPDHAAPAGRRRRWIAPLVALVAVVGLLLAGTAWWVTTGRWTEVPSLVGLDQAAAQRLLGEAELVVSGEVVRVIDDAAAPGSVVATDPPGATRLLRGGTVALTVSSGRPVVPSIAPGTAVEVAEQAVRDAGLAPERSASDAEFSDTAPAGTVVRTDPGAGAELDVGGAVTLVVSRGPEPPPEPEQVRVPFVIGRDADTAEDILEDAGLEVELRPVVPFGGRGRDRDRDRTVVGQSLGAGSMVDEDTTIVLDII